MLTPGVILKKRRQEMAKTIRQVSQETKINEKYIVALEEDQYKEFDSPVFASGFVKIYSTYLSLDTDKILALYRRASQETAKPSKKIIFRKINFTNLLNPKNLGIAGTLLAILLVVGYFNIQFSNFQKTPELTITSPNPAVETIEEKIAITGELSKGSKLTINDKLISENKETFSEEFDLNLGKNIFIIKAQNTSNSSKSIHTEIVVTRIAAQEEITDEEEDIKTEASVKINITESSAWVQLIVDGEQKIAQIIPLGISEEFLAKDSVEIISGRPTITKLLINDIEYPLSVNPETGVASLTCDIKKGEAVCE